METIAIVTADAKSRVTLRGIRQGTRFRLAKDDSGFHLAPVMDDDEPRRRNPDRRDLPVPKKPLSEYLEALREEGLALKPLKHSDVGPCRF